MEGGFRSTPVARWNSRCFEYVFFKLLFMIHFGGLIRLSFDFFGAQMVGAGGAVRKLRPRSLGPKPTLAHMAERRGIRVRPRLVSPGKVEF